MFSLSLTDVLCQLTLVPLYHTICEYSICICGISYIIFKEKEPRRTAPILIPIIFLMLSNNQDLLQFSTLLYFTTSQPVIVTRNHNLQIIILRHYLHFRHETYSYTFIWFIFIITHNCNRTICLQTMFRYKPV